MSLFVIPAEAGIHVSVRIADVDPGLRRDDEQGPPRFDAFQ